VIVARIGLIDVDGHNYPNLALMKISAYHKAKSDSVEWAIPMLQYDRVYIAKVFTFSEDFDTCINANEIIQGGTGYDLKNKLPKEIENIYPDYSLYNVKAAYGFLTRGCPRGCKFCIVGEKEGLCSCKVADLKQFWTNQKEIIIQDPNLLACDDWKELLQQLIDSKSWIDINQGFDIRVMTDEKAYMINQLKIKMLHFAWDNYEFKTYDKLKDFRNKLDFDFRKLRVYVLTNFNTTFEQDLERVYKLKELGYDPYVMIYNKDTAPKQIRRLQRWVNNKFIFRKCEKFEDYQKVG
jgi:hypothetical protein